MAVRLVNESDKRQATGGKLSQEGLPPVNLTLLTA
jgi:hypothetical protein